MQESIENQRASIENKIQQDYEYLLEQNLIEEIEVNPIELFNKKLDSLLTNDLKIKRIYSKYELFFLPFDIQQKEKIIDLFDELINVAESRKRKNTTMKAVLESYASLSIEEITSLSIR